MTIVFHTIYSISVTQLLYLFVFLQNIPKQTMLLARYCHLLGWSARSSYQMVD